MKAKKVMLVVEPSGQAMNRIFDALNKPPKKPQSNTEIISFPDYETLGKVITGARLELLHTIRTDKPKSIQELARMVKRDFKNVHQDVTLLVQFGLVELKAAGPRRAMSPAAKYSEIVLTA